MSKRFNQSNSNSEARNNLCLLDLPNDDKDAFGVKGSILEKLDDSVGDDKIIYGFSDQNFDITCHDVANFFLACGNEFGDPMTNLRLQKLVYYAQAWYLANYGKPLFTEDFEAWVHGPVIPELYQKYKRYGPNPIYSNVSLSDIEKRFDEDTKNFLREIAEVYLSFTTYNLERMTHFEDPWTMVRKGFPADASCNNIISKDSMRMYYAKRLEETDQT